VSTAGGTPFEAVLNFQVAAPSRFSKGWWVCFFSSMSQLAMELKGNRNPDPFQSKGSGTRKSEANHSPLTRWVGIIQSCAIIPR
jgi:hypothetical protein